MSYDIDFVRHRHGQDWEEAVEEATARTEAAPALDEQRRRQWGEIERRVAALVGDVESELQEKAGELADPRTGLQVSLFSHEAAVSYPYWDQPDRESFHRLVADVVRVVEEVTGLSAYDPQTGEAFSGSPADARGLEVRRVLEEQDAVDQDRARARRYLRVGAVITLVTVVYMLTVRTSGLIVFALLVGIVDLALGAHFALRVRRAQVP